MAFDEHLAEQARELLGHRTDVDERRMFGGIGFLVAGNMCCGVHGDELIARLDPAETVDADAARPFDMTGRPMRGWYFVSPADEEDLERWVRRCEAFAAGLPPK